MAQNVKTKIAERKCILPLRKEDLSRQEIIVAARQKEKGREYLAPLAGKATALLFTL
jgi:hypothetical protein